ncbi:MAG: acyl-CoA dehydrogenase family protein, partial [Proteobacteria bacterium]|nr:acyl-CoA dehydrogenase family protein [Pseudomonadota bacterium]
MNFEYSEEQQQLADSIGKYLANEYSFEKRKATLTSPTGLSDAAWTAFAELGLTSIALPEADGGFGGGALDLMAAMEACGEALVVEPLLDNIALGGRLVSRAGSPEQRQAMLPGLMAGSLKLAFAGLEPGDRYALTPSRTHARADGDGWVIDGEKCVVVGASSADRLIVSALTDPAGGVSLFVVDRLADGVTLNPSRSVDGLRVADVRLAGVKLAGAALLGPLGAAMPLIEEAVDFATALLCADAIGAMKSANDATLEYMKTRKQFGVPIASFQVLQHRMVEMYIVCEQARSMAILAAAKVDAGGDAVERSIAVSMAKVKIADAARQISQESVQLHG